jgi:NAD(P)-dependent dehydrogenase (short-subunit alcohol dehydrogenase family)
MDLELTGRVALVVGGTGVVGTAVAEALRAEGAIVVVAARNPGTDGIAMNTRDEASVQAGVDAVLERHGAIHVLVNTAAPAAGTLDASRDRDPRQILDAVDGKAMGYLRCANAVLPVMQRQGFGRIVNVSGQNGYLTGSVTGSVRNSAVMVISKNLADSLAGSGITVNVVNPGRVVDSPSSEVAVGAGGESSPAQVAALVTFLASGPAAAISGESIAVGHRVRGVQ